MDLGEDLGILKKSGSWYSYGDTQLGQGKESAREFLKDVKNATLRNEIEQKIREKLGFMRKKKEMIKAKVG
ncbi:unnamed protein product [marine sediment metagenome]|uniref:RecA-like C-terminal domain-containing protein n=1 Tax=marine sediment metagenome TaxID=412755 RepID=X1JKX5_9ZZZZ